MHVTKGSVLCPNMAGMDGGKRHKSFFKSQGEKQICAWQVEKMIDQMSEHCTV